MADFVNTIDLLGDKAVLAGIISNTFQGEFRDNVVYKIKKYSFEYCDSLTSADLPKVTTVEDYAFFKCTALTSVNLPLWNPYSPTSSVFLNCSSLPSIDLPKVARIGTSMFSGCTVLKTVILRVTSVCSLSSVNAFDKTPFASGGTGGTVYVPQALIESYKTATNWSTLYAAGTCNFVAIEGSEYE